MNNVKPLISWTLWHPETNVRLTMQYGRVVDDAGVSIPGVITQRWCFYGKRIPMPVRSGTWFEGLSAPEMIEWLKREGWMAQTRTNLVSGVTYAYSDDKLAEVIRHLAHDGLTSVASIVYRYAYDVSLESAEGAVREMRRLDATN